MANRSDLVTLLPRSKRRKGDSHAIPEEFREKVEQVFEQAARHGLVPRIPGHLPAYGTTGLHYYRRDQSWLEILTR